MQAIGQILRPISQRVRHIVTMLSAYTTNDCLIVCLASSKQTPWWSQYGMISARENGIPNPLHNATVKDDIPNNLFKTGRNSKQ